MATTMQKPRPKIGDVVYQVEWCHKMAFDECGDMDRDNCTMMADCPSYGWIRGFWDDPFTAWVEADRWYCEHVEGQPGATS